MVLTHNNFDSFLSSEFVRSVAGKAYHFFIMLLNFAFLTLCLAVGTFGRTMYVQHQLPRH